MSNTADQKVYLSGPERSVQAAIEHIRSQRWGVTVRSLASGMRLDYGYPWTLDGDLLKQVSENYSILVRAVAWEPCAAMKAWAAEWQAGMERWHLTIPANVNNVFAPGLDSKGRVDLGDIPKGLSVMPAEPSHQDDCDEGGFEEGI